MQQSPLVSLRAVDLRLPSPPWAGDKEQGEDQHNRMLGEFACPDGLI